MPTVIIMLRYAGLLFCLFGSAVASPQSAIIESLDDLDFGTVAPTIGALKRSTPLCVALDAPGGYRLVAHGSGSAGEFTLQGGTAPLAYRVRYGDQRRGAGRALFAGEWVTGFGGQGSTVSGHCRRMNARLWVRLDAPALQSAASGRYRGTLRLTVSPE